jgi:hypothetical protein
VALAQDFLKKHKYFLKLDVRHYFQTIPHTTIAGVLEAFDVPSRYVTLCRTILAQEGDGRGMCIGALTSQFFGNLGLHPVEVMLRERFPDCDHVRYMDDEVVFGPTKPRLWEAHAAVRAEVCRHGMELKDQATVLAPATEGLSFLGYRVFRGALRLDAGARRRLGRRILSMDRAFREGRVEADRARASIANCLSHAAAADTLEWRRWLVGNLGV